MEQVYEYTVIQPDAPDPDHIDQQVLQSTLDTFAAAGWRVVSIHWPQSGNPLTVVFERPTSPSTKRLSPRELMQLPFAERERILQQSAELAFHDYTTDSDLTDFEAYGEGDFYDDTP